MSDGILQVESIDKQFEKHKAVDALSFDVHRGEIFALLGPNGAGKTTTIRMLLGIIKPDAGSIRFALDGNIGGLPHPSMVGYLPEDRGLYREIPILKTLTYMGVLHGLERKVATASARYWLERVELQDRAEDKLGTLSKGNQQKVQFISAILHRPQFAILDEPFAGLDPVNQDFFIDIIRELREHGATILLCAHQMELVERLADRVLLLDQGAEILEGTLTEIRERSATSNKVVVKVNEGTDLTSLMKSPMIQRIEQRGVGEFAFHIKKGEPLHKFLMLVTSSLELIEIHTEKISLHDIFVQSVGKKNPTGETESGP